MAHLERTTPKSGCPTSLSERSAPLSPDQLRGNQLRSNLLHKLGIVDTARLQPPIRYYRESSRGALLLDHVHILHEHLKDPVTSSRVEQDKTEKFQSNSAFFVALATAFSLNPQQRKEDSVDHTSTLPSPLPEEKPDLDVCSDASDSSASASDDHRRVAFHDDVTVVLIPRRDEYSDRMRKCLWDSTQISQANIMRNTLEFAAERYEVKKVLEEEDFIRSPETGELVHPIHIEIAKFLRHERGLPETGNVEALLQTR